MSLHMIPRTLHMIPRTRRFQLASVALGMSLSMVAAGVAQPPKPTPRCPGEETGERIGFDLPFPQEQGGGNVVGCAGGLEFEPEGNRAVLSGGVEIRYEDLLLQADTAEVDLDTKQVTATGNVILDQGPRRLSGATLDFDFNTKNGRLTEASAFLAPDYYFTGEEVAKVGEDVYTVDHGSFTACPQEVPSWSFKLQRAKVEMGGYARVHNASFRFKKVPILYSPYILVPTKSRASGFLVPQPGFSRRRGSSLSLAYYQVLGRSYDTTFELDAYSEGTLGFGGELRYRPTEGTRGTFSGYVIQDEEVVGEGIDDLRWKVDWDHETRDLPWGMRGVVSFHDFSDFEFFRDFERDFSRNAIRTLESRGFVTGNWGPHLLNILLNRQETFITSDSVIRLAKLPEIEYRLRPTRLGRTPLYLTLNSSLDFLSLNRSETLDSQYLRADFFPQITVPVRTVPWLSLSVTAGERLTFYGDTLKPLADRAVGEDEFSGETITRTLPFASAEIVGPSFSRIFGSGKPQGEGEKKKGVAKFKHVVEPRFSYSFLDRFDEQEEVPLFDEVDNLRSTNQGRVALINRLLAKPANERESAREILLFELSQSFSFDDDQPLQVGNLTFLDENGVEQVERLTRSAGPINALLRFDPARGISFKAQLVYNTLFDNVASSSVSGRYTFPGNNFLDLTYFNRARPETGETVSQQVRFGGGIFVLPRRLRLEGQVNVDLEQQLLQQMRWIVSWRAQCYSLRFEVRDFRTGNTRDRDFRFALALKNVGTFLDFTGGTSHLQ